MAAASKEPVKDYPHLASGDAVMAAFIGCMPERDVSSPQGELPGLSIDQEVACRLRRSGYLALRDVSCDVRGGMLSLHGRLPTHYLKQVAQAIAVEVEGVTSVVNRIDVVASKPGAVGGTKPCACPTSR